MDSYSKVVLSESLYTLLQFGPNLLNHPLDVTQGSPTVCPRAPLVPSEEFWGARGDFIIIYKGV
jgi:hypothetical protein